MPVKNSDAEYVYRKAEEKKRIKEKRKKKIFQPPNATLLSETPMNDINVTSFTIGDKASFL